MPRRQPFTALCQTVATLTARARADLHVHTTHSDGHYTPAQIVDLARRSGLAAVAITDHDTVSGVAEARAAAPAGLEAIAGVEITSEYQGKELHLLGYFFRPDDEPLLAALKRLRHHRVERFYAMVDRLRATGIDLPEHEVHSRVGSRAVGRRHLAELLVGAQRAGTVRQAFARYLHDDNPVVVAKERLPVVEALALVRQAGGVAAWAHPPYDCNLESLAELRDHGLAAVEGVYPGMRPARQRQLRAWAAALDLAVTGGSDCHGPEPLHRAVGACGISTGELEQLRQRILP